MDAAATFTEQKLQAIVASRLKLLLSRSRWINRWLKT